MDTERIPTEQELLAQFDRESNVRIFTGVYDKLVKALLFAFMMYVLWMTLIATPNEQVRRSSFVGLMVLLGFIMYPRKLGNSGRVNYIPWYDIVLGLLGCAAFFHFVVDFEGLIERSTMLTRFDVWCGVVGGLILVELCRRVVGIPILVVAGAFVFYAFYDGFSVRRVIHHLFYTTDGIIGTPIGVCSTFIVLFILLASFLEKSGVAKFFIDLANSVAGFASGGPAKVAIISSAFEGMYSGSSVANTVCSGSVTIPIMKKMNYKPEFAAAVEAAASTGGQIMPPIMGAAAFLMAEITNIPYATIALAATLPAVLYFAGIFMMVHFESKKLGLKGLPRESLPKLHLLLIRHGYLFIPVLVLVYLMGAGRTPSYSACLAVLATIVVSSLRKSTRLTKTTFIEAVTNATRNTVGIAIACAVAGTIVGTVTLTGVGQLLINSLVSLSHNNLLLALFLTMIACIVLGMGIPTTANYVIMATITAPIVVQMGIPLLAAHMFVFYFGIVADITPPVALAAYAGAAIAKCNPIKTAITATRLAIAAFLMPYMFVMNPAMLLIDASAGQVVQIALTSFIGMTSLAAGLEGYMLTRMSPLERLAAVAGGLLLIDPHLLTDVIGVGCILLAVGTQIVKRRGDRPVL